LPPQLLQLFAPRPALRYLLPSDYAPEERRTPKVTGVAQYVQAAKEYEDNYVPTESWLQRKDRERMERDAAALYRVTEGFKNECAQTQPTLSFVHTTDTRTSQSSLMKTPTLLATL
jgi:U1 small nuclear ribonucleoprotein